MPVEAAPVQSAVRLRPTIANFAERLERVVRDAAPTDAQVDIFPMDPGGVWQLGARIVTPAFRDVSDDERELPLWGAVLDHLWDEQGRVGGLFAYTPEEYPGRAAPAGAGPGTGAGGGDRD